VAFPGRPMLAMRPRPVMAVGLAVLLAAPLAYCVDTVATPQTVLTAADPSAGPSTVDPLASVVAQLGSPQAARLYAGFMNGAATLTPAQREVLTYVTEHAPTARIQLGYIGFDPTPSTAQLAHWSRTGQLAYVLLPGPLLQLGKSARSHAGASPVNLSALVARIAWLSRHCPPVPPTQIGPNAAPAGLLLRCAAVPPLRNSQLWLPHK
jgi:hypothetical protein